MSVSGTGILITPDEVFLGSMGLATVFTPEGDPSYSPLEDNGTRDLPRIPLYRLERPLPIGRLITLLRHSFGFNATRMVQEY